MSLDVVFLGAARQAALVRSKQLSPVELVRAYFDRIDRLDGRLRAYITVCRETALQAARRAEEAVTRGGLLGPARTRRPRASSRGARSRHRPRWPARPPSPCRAASAPGACR